MLKIRNENDTTTIIDKLKDVQKVYAKFTQEQVDHIFYCAASAASNERISLAKMAVEETKMGYIEDKVIKNHFASEFIYNKYKDVKTCGVLSTDEAAGIQVIAEPIGVICAVVPTTNPTSTAIFKVLMALKTRNAIALAPHPRARQSTIAAAKIVMDAAVKAGAPEGLLAVVDEVEEGVNPVKLTNLLMANADLILATGGPGMVKAAYSSGTPAIGVGAGNTAVLVDASADIELTASSIILSKSFDYGVICASEQSIVVNDSIYNDVKAEMEKRGAYFLNKSELKKVQDIILVDGNLNGALVGQSPQVIAGIAGIKVPDYTRIIVGEVTDYTLAEPFAHEKLSILLAMYKFKTVEEGITICARLIDDSGLGHTSAIYCDEMKKDLISQFSAAMNTSRILVNTPSSQGGIGDIYNFSFAPSLTLGCGSWGGNSISENVGPSHLINTKTVATRRENMSWFKVPEKIYYKYGCLSGALSDLAGEYKKVFVVTDKALDELGYTKFVTNELVKHGIDFKVFSDVEPDPTISNVMAGTKQMLSYNPDCIIALGGGSAMDAAKIMWVMYEHPDTDFKDLASRFMDIRKRIHKFPKLGKKAYFVAIASTSGTGSEVTPFSVITDDDGAKYPLADYEITPNMAINDPILAMTMPAGLCAASGIDVLTHAIEAYVSVLATEYTKSLSLASCKLVQNSLVNSYKGGSTDKKAKEEMANASNLAGMAFANAFLGICHSLAHKLGAKYHIPHGIANALMFNEVIIYNATNKPMRQATFSQYDHMTTMTDYSDIAKHLGATGKDEVKNVEYLLDLITTLKKDLNISLSIKDYGVDEKEFLADVAKLSEDAFDDQCTGANPRYPQIKDLEEIYLRAYYGKDYKGTKTYKIGG